MKIIIAAFGGEIPKTLPRLLDNNFAQMAVNTKLEDGSITPIRRARFDAALPGISQTIYRYGEQWFGWPGFVQVAQGPVAGDRLYFTGDGVPKLRVAGTDYQLKVPRPSAQLTIQVNGEVNKDLSSNVVYAYTNVTQFDEESEPSPLSGEIIWSPGLSVTLGAFDEPDVARGVNRQRIYRSQTSSLGVTTLNFIAERAASTDLFMDNALPIVEPIGSGDFNPPPDDLVGLVAGPNGMMAAYVGKKVYFSEPYVPHAWPEKYVLTVDYEVMGLGWIGGSLAILTKASPYIATGSAPENMVMEKLEVNLPCINPQGVVDLGYTIAYPSHAGLVTISTSGATVATASMMTRDQWLKMNPYSFKAAQYSGRYMASYAYTDDSQVEQRGTIIIDLTGATPFIIRNSDFADAMFYDVEDGALFILSEGSQIYEWDALSQPFGEQTWMSKPFVLPTYCNFGAILIEGGDSASSGQRALIAARNAEIRAHNKALIEGPVVSGAFGYDQIGTVPVGGSLLRFAEEDVPVLGVTIVADGREVAYVSKLNDVARLPSGFMARTWQLIVRGNVQVTNIVLAASPTEIAGG